MKESEELHIHGPSPEMPANIESAFAKATEIAEREAIQPMSFVKPDGSNRERIEKDLARVDRKKREYATQHEGENYKLAKAVEVAMYEGVNDQKWFGPDAKMVLPSEFDDYVNGADGILEIHKQEGHQSYLGIGIDVTSHHEPKRKFEIIEQQISSGRLGEVKYFRSSDGSVKKSLEMLPRAVVVLKAVDATRLVRDWDEGKQEQSGQKLRGLILYQLGIQFSAFGEYAESLEYQFPNRVKISQIYTEALEDIARLLASQVNEEDIEQLENHPSVQMVRKELERFQLDFSDQEDVSDK